MENQTRGRGLDLFKLIVTLGLIAALFYFYFQSQHVPPVTAAVPILIPTVANIVAQPTPKMALPEIPAGVANLSLDEVQKKLLAPDGQAVFELDKAGTSWQPVVPPELAALSGGLSLMKDKAGKWILAPQDGIARFRWDASSFSYKEAQDILATLPEFPQTDVDLKFDEVQGALVGQGGVILFRLNKDINDWVPTVPEEILKQAGVTEPSHLDTGEWVVIDSNGKVIYRFITIKATWEAVEEPISELPEFPASEVELSYDEATNQLLAPDGSAVYLLNSEAGAWIPVIPADIAAGLPEGYTVIRVEDNWVINEPDGASLYSWDAMELLWVGSQQPETGGTPTPTPGPTAAPVAVVCQGALPSRIQVGDTVHVVTSLNLRTSPGIKNRLIRSHPTGTTLEVIGGPECVLQEEGAYLWWNVQNPDGTTGWSAEGSNTGKFYFLEPVNK